MAERPRVPQPVIRPSAPRTTASPPQQQPLNDTGPCVRPWTTAWLYAHLALSTRSSRPARVEAVIRNQVRSRSDIAAVHEGVLLRAFPSLRIAFEAIGSAVSWKSAQASPLAGEVTHPSAGVLP